MILNYDLGIRQFVSAAGSLNPIRVLRFMRGEDRDIELHLQENGTAWEAGGTASITFGIKSAPGEGSEALAIIEPEGFSEEDGVYSGTLGLDGESLPELLGSDFSLRLFSQLVLWWRKKSGRLGY